jgi:RNA polymerase sigma-70 factor (ECF subfamily)
MASGPLNRAGFEQLFRQYYPALVTYLVREFRLTDNAEDLVQTVFSQVWAKRDRFNPEQGVSPYLYAAARHAALNYLRDNKRYDTHDDYTIEDELDNIPAAEQDAVSVLEHKDLEDAVYAAVESLPPRAREIWALHRDHGLTYPEIAATLGISINTVKTQIGRSLTVLRKAAVPFLVALVTLAGGMRSL